MQLIVGLGNPGTKYAATRHNIGFRIADAVATQTRLQFTVVPAGETRLARLTARLRQHITALVAQGTYAGRAFVLVKPQTFMNRSGEVVATCLRTLQIDLHDLLIIFDDINLPTGTIRLRKTGGAGGHNGMQNIIDHLGTSAFPRLRVGIGNDFAPGQQVEYVLSPFTASEHPAVEVAITQASDAVLTYIQEGIDHAMNQFNRRQP